MVVTLQYYLLWRVLANLHQFQKREIYKKLENEFFSSYLSIYRSSTRYRRDWGSNQENLKSLFQNEYIQFLAILGPLSAERAGRGERRSRFKSPEFPPGTPNMKLESQLCSLLKVIQI